jgi:hypothetical protein
VSVRGTGKLIEATTTPLASIFGSGFLVIVPILAGAVGRHAVWAMAAVCALAYAVGSVVRFNIRHAEPALADDPSEATLSFERASDLALIVAYVISVCLYIHILSAFVLGGLHADTQLNEDLLTSAVIVAITAIGVFRGLKVLERLEEWALYVTLVVIAALLAGFGAYDWTAWRGPGGIALPEPLAHTPWEILTILAGTLIVVQGFETPRYLGEVFDEPTRVRASRWSQLVSTAVYVVFVAAALPVASGLDGHYGDNSLIQMVRIAAGLLTVPLVAAAALSQFAAAVADTLAASGNLEEVTHEHLKERFGYLVVGGGALALTWSADTFEVVALASRAFAFYYLLQCLVAITVCRSTLRRIGMAGLAAVLGFVTVFAVPAG